jgi:hypothetical protein
MSCKISNKRDKMDDGGQMTDDGDEKSGVDSLESIVVFNFPLYPIDQFQINQPKKIPSPKRRDDNL